MSNKFKLWKITIFNTPIFTPMIRIFSRILCWAFHWKIDVNTIKVKKGVMIMAPHNSNWDFLIMLATALKYKRRVCYAGKEQLFKPAFGWFFRWCGGFPIYDEPGLGTVDICAQWIKNNDEIILGISPSGTRRCTNWRSGFYHIAVKANVPIIMSYIDIKKRQSGILGIFEPTGSYEKDLIALKEYYKKLEHPDQ